MRMILGQRVFTRSWSDLTALRVGRCLWEKQRSYRRVGSCLSLDQRRHLMDDALAYRGGPEKSVHAPQAGHLAAASHSSRPSIVIV